MSGFENPPTALFLAQCFALQSCSAQRIVKMKKHAAAFAILALVFGSNAHADWVCHGCKPSLATDIMICDSCEYE